MNGDRELLLGVLGVQAGFVTAGQVASASAPGAEGRSLLARLEDSGALDAKRRRLLEAIADEALAGGQGRRAARPPAPRRRACAPRRPRRRRARDPVRARRAVHAPRRARPRRPVGRQARHRRAHGPRGGAEGAPRAAAGAGLDGDGEHGGGRALPSRGAAHRAARSPGHRRGARSGAQARRDVPLRAEARPRRDAEGAARALPVARRAARPPHAPHRRLPGGGIRALARRHPPRPQAVEHHGRWRAARPSCSTSGLAKRRGRGPSRR